MIELLKNSFKRLQLRKGSDSAAVLSFSTLFALVPMLSLVFSVFSISSYFAGLQQHLEGFLFSQLLPQNYEVVVEYINKFVLSAQKLTGISFVFLLITSIVLFYNVDRRIKSIWDEGKSRNIGIDLIFYLLVLLLGPLCLAGSLFVSSYIGASKLFIFIPMGGILISSLPIVLSAIGLSLLYYFTANEKIHFINSLKAGFIVAFFLEVLKSIMLIYIHYFPMNELIYGTLSMLLLFMLWIYFSWLLVLFGAAINFCLNEKKTNV